MFEHSLGYKLERSAEKVEASIDYNTINDLPSRTLLEGIAYTATTKYLAEIRKSGSSLDDRGDAERLSELISSSFEELRAKGLDTKHIDPPLPKFFAESLRLAREYLDQIIL